jgi:hypothetical protein
MGWKFQISLLALSQAFQGQKAKIEKCSAYKARKES